MKIDREAFIRNWVEASVPSLLGTGCGKYTREELEWAAGQGVDRYIDWALSIQPFKVTITVPGHVNSIVFEMPMNIAFSEAIEPELRPPGRLGR